MASMDGRQSVGLTPPKPAGRNGEQRDATPNTAKYVTLPPCRLVQTERSRRRLLAIRRYPSCLNINIVLLHGAESSSHIACFPVAADWRFVRIVRRRRFDDDHGYGNCSGRRENNEYCGYV